MPSLEKTGPVPRPSLEHVAVWTKDLEGMRRFYADHLGGEAGDRFEIANVGFASYFVRFGGGVRLELMWMPGIPLSRDDVDRQFTGFIHIAFDVGTGDALADHLARMTADGVRVLEAPHVTADGYLEATVLDPDGNRVELCVLPEAV